jgi:serine/threonine protein kinase
MGVVYLARDEALLRSTAVKILSWQDAERDGQNPEEWFLAEARSVARINHPNVVQIYGVARQGRHCYIAMEFMAGGPLDALVAKAGVIDSVRATTLLIECAKALQAAHDAGVIHRDIKPENVFIGGDGNAKLGDFGMALHLAKPRQNEPSRAGTPRYTAPEIWLGQPASVSTDLYALGATYYFMLTGQAPYLESELGALATAHRQSPIPNASALVKGVPRECDALIRTCLAKTPKERFESARALIQYAQKLLPIIGDKSPMHNSVPRDVSSQTVDDRRPQLPVPRDTGGNESLSSGTSEGLHVDQSAELRQWLADENSRVVVVTGERGSGKSWLLRGLVEQWSKHGTTFFVEGLAVRVSGVAPTAHMLKYLATPHANKSPSANVDWQSLLGEGLSVPTLFVIDSSRGSLIEYRSLVATLLRFAGGPIWKIAISAGSGERPLWQQLNREADGLIVRICDIPSLTLKHSVEFVRAQFSLNYGSEPKFILTPDAALLLAYFGQRNPGRILELMRSAVESKGGKRTFTVSARDIWNSQPDNLASSNEYLDAKSVADSGAQSWPTPEVLSLINQCRQVCGMPLRR